MKILEEIRVDYPKIPYKLYNKIYNYIESRNMSEKKSDANILTNSLPFNLKNVLLLIMYQNDIRNLKVFKGCQNSNFIISLLSNFVSSTSKKSEFLVYEGEMIEDIIIIKDGRLSLEAAIDMENPEISIRNYFNVKFQGISTEKEMKKMNELKKESNTQLILSKKRNDFDKVRAILNSAVKKQTNNLLNEGCEETFILDRSRNDIKNDFQTEKIVHSTSDHLKNEPIKNEKGNFKYIKIIDIKKNENHGGLYIFMRRPSPLSLKVRSKFAELYLLPKKEVFNIAKNYRNIWNKIHKKDFHNMLSIKHKTFNILNKYIEINGICKISPNDVSRYVYPWEDIERKNKNLKAIKNNEKDNNNNKDNIIDNKKYNAKQYLYFKKDSNPSPIKNNKNLKNHINFRSNLFSNKSITNSLPSNNKENQPLTTETDFSHLLNLMVNKKQQNNNLNTNSNLLNSNKNINNNLINKNTLEKNSRDKSNLSEKKDSSKSFASKFFDNKQKTNNSEEGKTFIITNNSEKLLPTLNNIFNENKVVKIKEELKKTRKKENKKKLFSFGKNIAKIFKNENYSIFLVGNSTNEFIEIKNKNNMNISNKNLISDDKEIDMNNYITFCQNKLFFDKISEISSSSEAGSHQFDNKSLSKEEVISFSLDSIYENINVHSKMKYSEDKKLQEKTLNYITKLIENSNYQSSSSNFSSSFNLSKSNSFFVNLPNNKYKEKNPNLLSLNVKSSKANNDSISIFVQKLEEFSNENIDFKSDNSKKSYKTKNVSLDRKINNTLKPKSNKKQKDFRHHSMKPKKILFDDDKNKKNPSYFKVDDKTVINFDTNNESNSEIDILNNNSKSRKSMQSKFSEVMHKNANYLKMQPKKRSHFFKSEIVKSEINNMKTVKNPKTPNRLSLNMNKRVSNVSESKISKRSSVKGKISKKLSKRRSKQNKNNTQLKKFKSEQQLIKFENEFEKGGIRNSKAYFAKEEKEDCIII